MESLKKFFIDLIMQMVTAAVKAAVTASRTIVHGKKGDWEGKLKAKATKDGWNKLNATLPVALFLLVASGCAPAAIVLQNGQSVMLAKDRKARCFVLAEDGSKYRTTVRLRAGWICGPVDFGDGEK